MLLAARNLKDGDIVWTKSWKVVIGLSCWHLWTEAELPVPIRAPREHFCEVIGRVGSVWWRPVRLILAVVSDGASARFDPQIVTAIVASQSACTIDLGASSWLGDMILWTSLHWATLRTMTPGFVVVCRFARISALFLVLIFTAGSAAAMGFTSNHVRLLHCFSKSINCITDQLFKFS